MIEKVHQGNAKIEDDLQTLTITIPMKKNWFILIFMTFWLVFWSNAEKSVFESIFLNLDHISDNIPYLMWFIAWTLGGLYALFIILWMLIGKEKIICKDGVLEIKKGLSNFYFINKKYDCKSISKLEASEVDIFKISFFYPNTFRSAKMFFEGLLKFSYGMKTISFGINLDLVEANFLKNIISRKINSTKNISRIEFDGIKK